MVAQRKDEPGVVLPWRQRAAVMVADKAKSGGIIVKPQYLVRAQRQLRLPGRAKDFLEYLDEGTYFKHGIHQQKGTAENWCKFDLPKWSLGMGMPKPNIHRLREYLLALHIIQIQVDNEGTVWIGWNLNTEEWIAPPKHGGSRTGAGRPKNQDDNGCLPSKIIQDDNGIFQDDNGSQFKMITTERLEDRQEGASSAPIRTLSKEDQESTDANASGGAAHAVAPPSPLPLLPLQEKAAAIPAGRTRSRASPKAKDAWKEDPAWKAVFAAGKQSLEERYGDNFNRPLEGGALKKLFQNFHVTPEEVQDFWQATLLDPFWDTNDLSFTYMLKKIGGYRSSPQGYRANMQGKRKQHDEREKRTNGKTGRGDRSPATEHHESTRDIF